MCGIGNGRSSQMHCIVGNRTLQGVLCCMLLLLGNVVLYVSQILYVDRKYAYYAQYTYCAAESMDSFIECHLKHLLILTSTFNIGNITMISFQVIVRKFYHLGAFILQIAIKGLTCSQNKKLTAKG